MSRFFTLLIFYLLISRTTPAQSHYELSSGWKCSPIAAVEVSAPQLSSPSYPVASWKPAVVPGTVLTTLLQNKEIPDPFLGMNNEKIPDIYATGRKHYTYWFLNDFTELPESGKQTWLYLRGVNYSCDVFLNGHQLNKETHYGMFLRQSYNITAFLNKNGKNRLAVIVYPPDPVGNPNGGQGGDGTIARNVAHQYVAGWDWIQPVRDRNTGIWDKVIIEKTGAINIKNPHVVTKVPERRTPTGDQKPAYISPSAELENPTASRVEGTLSFKIGERTISQKVSIAPKSTSKVQLPSLSFSNPKLWWPNGYGDQHLYDGQFQFVLSDKTISDRAELKVGIREIQTDWNPVTRSRQLSVNGQKVFVKGANWIISDALLRFSKERYNAEIRFHRDMNLNLIRVWGGALTERPEFYEACDQYGLLVMQDFWGSGDCNGRWLDPMKRDDQWTRRNYPDNHSLFLKSAADQIKMIRNHASLAIWCGGNEITLPQDIMTPLRDSILPQQDGSRWFVDYSNSDAMSYNFLGGNGDGPYGIQDINYFWSFKTWPFNSEIGSVGTGDLESLERFLPDENLIAPQYSSESRKETVDSVWQYHKYIGYENHIEPYGKAKDLKDFGKKAQLVNYNQYRALLEGYTSRMWEWYTGTIIWKTQNPWTALRGQMYDYYLDPNAGLYGLRTGGKPVNAMYSPADSTIWLANNTFEHQYDRMLVVKAYDMEGKETNLGQVFVEIGASSAKPYLPLGKSIQSLAKEQGIFLSIRLLDLNQRVVSDNFYWLADSKGNFSGLKQLKSAPLKIRATETAAGKIAVTLQNPVNGPVGFFNRLSLVDPITKKRILPVFYSDNYVSILPGEEKKVILEYSSGSGSAPLVSVDGWNTGEQFIPVTR